MPIAPLSHQPIPFIDTFCEPLPAGQVIGSLLPVDPMNGSVHLARKGVDVESLLSIDHHALRIQPLLQPGWGRSGLAYGPYPRQNGLTFAVAVLNGHNTSQTVEALGSLAHRMKLWIQSGRTDPLAPRLWKVWRKRHAKRFTRKLARWWHLSTQPIPQITENLAVGWFPNESVKSPIEEGSALLIHAAGPKNGELWATTGKQPISAFQQLQDLPLYLVIALREQGAVYYAATLPGDAHLPAYPTLRPLGIDPTRAESQVYAGIHQSVSGEIGFHIDTRVYAAQVACLPEWVNWYGSAHAADRFSTDPAVVQTLDGKQAEKGGVWRILPTADPSQTTAMLLPEEESGLIHLRFRGEIAAGAALGLRWRAVDEQNYWQVQIKRESIELTLCQNGQPQGIAQESILPLSANEIHSLQILDNGNEFGLYFGGALLFGQRFTERQFMEGRGMSIQQCGEMTAAFHCLDFEAHPRTIPAPYGLTLPAPEWLPAAGEVALADTFQGDPADLHGRIAPVGQASWQHTLGRGRICLNGAGGAQVQATAERPNPGRTLYTLPWDAPNYADLSIQVLSPGSKRGEWHKGRSGLVFWQDKDNYLAINTWLDDVYQGASVSSFFYLNGFEELFDAVWTNVGNRVAWGQSHTLRIAFDGLHYLAFVNNEPVLYRSLTDVYPDFKPLAIHRVGILVNWEWDDDTGSLFQSFEARKRGANDR